METTGVILIIIGIIAVIGILVKLGARSHDRLLQQVEDENKSQGEKFLDDLRGKYGELTLFKRPCTTTIRYNGNSFYKNYDYVIDMKDAHKILIRESVRTPIGNVYTENDFPEIFDYSDVTEYELYEEGVESFGSSHTSITKTNTSNLIKRVAIGTALGGGVGAIIGGATAQTETVTSNHHSNAQRWCALRIKVAGLREYICIECEKGRNTTYYHRSWHEYIQDIEYTLARIIEENNKN